MISNPLTFFSLSFFLTFSSSFPPSFYLLKNANYARISVEEKEKKIGNQGECARKPGEN
jgi:hypothetical protein